MKTGEPKSSIQNYWVFGLFVPLSGIIGTRKHEASENGSVSVLRRKKLKNPSNSVCYTPSSEPFRIYQKSAVP
jgi:hypothetical protein